MSNQLKQYDETIKRKRSVAHLAVINKDDEYGTPKYLAIDAFKRYNIKPKIDVFASDKLHILDNYWTIKDNTFALDLTLDAFANIPYSKAYQSIEYLYRMHLKHNLNIIILCYNKSDTDWYHDFIYDIKHDKWNAEIKPINKRIRFLDNEGKPMKNKDPKSKNYGKPQYAPYPNIWIIFRKQGKFKRLIFWLKKLHTNPYQKNKQ